MKKTFEELERLVIDCPVQIGQSWRHYKGGIYKVVDKVIDCNTNEVVLTYDYTEPNTFMTIRFCRPLAEWLSTTEDGQPRFSLVKKRELYLTDEEYKQVKGI